MNQFEINAMKKLSLFVIFSVLWIFEKVPAQAQTYTRIQNEIYARAGGIGYLMDVLIPEKQNGIAVIQVVNGGWVSQGPSQKPTSFLPFLEKGQTVFFVGTGSRPIYKADEMVSQVQQAVSYIRKHAQRFGVRPDAVAMTGGSSGGVIGLLAVLTAPDSSKVSAGAFFYPGTDLIDWNGNGETFFDNPKAYGRRSQAFRTRKGEDTLQVYSELRAMSPIRYVTPASPPILLFHGTADTVIPCYQSRIFVRRLEENRVPFRLVEYEGRGHGWKGKDKDYALMAEWFEQYLNKL